MINESVDVDRKQPLCSVDERRQRLIEPDVGNVELGFLERSG